ncbi:MAG: hypothetical protein V1492_06145 [Candidatus Micrarchaeota archaeon]
MKVKVIFNPLKSWAAALAAAVKRHLRQASHHIVAKGAEVTVCIGGDGTILYGNHKKKIQGKILGIGSRRSYICQLRRDNWKKELLSKLQDNTDDMFVLDYAAKGIRGTAVNDVVVHAKNYRVLGINLQAAGKKHFFRGDGLIISSAIGSTGYAYSAGGKAVAPTAKILQLVPIAPYRRTFKGMAVRGNDRVVVSANRACALIIDGIYLKELKANESVAIRKSKSLQFFKGVGWYE